jgi:BlaI family transcriptional regulator, penicillinase repressor
MARKGTLESKILDILWDGGELPVRDVLERTEGQYAYTTIATVLDRLHAKGLVCRAKREGAWWYRAARPRNESIGADVARLMADVRGDPQPLLSAFLDGAEERDPDLLDQLEQLIRERRRRRT